MSFLFKSSKNKQPPSALPTATRNIRSSDGPPTSVQPLNGAVSRDPRPRSPTGGASANGSMNSNLAEKAPSRGLEEGKASLEKASMTPSPEQKTLRDRSDSEKQMNPPSRIAMAPSRPAPDPSPYPWSQRQLIHAVPHIYPFPRYGAAVNSVASKDGAIFIMGGLINGSTVKGDLWMIEAGPNGPTCFPIQTTSEGPGPRVGHASLLVGNAFIVFGGDTKTEETDLLDDTLYLLNTSTKQWSRAAPAGPRPPGRYGHTLSILGSKIYIFGGQVEGFFFNDLVAFDLNALQQASNRWEILIQNTIDGGPPHGHIPPARTNHTMVTWNDRLYLFGGTDGVTWFNDVWSYDSRTNSWSQLECIGYIPTAREGHAAALVGDVMYIFGGRTEEGNDLGDLAAFRISSRRWYTFQNMGPSPSPRSGHSMTAIGKTIAVLAGEPSSAPRDAGELSLAYFLDTGKIRYPTDSQSQIPADQRVQGHRRPSGDKTMIPQGRNMGPITNGIGSTRQMSPENNSPVQRNNEFANGGSRLPRVTGTTSPPGMMSPQPSVNALNGMTGPAGPNGLNGQGAPNINGPSTLIGAGTLAGAGAAAGIVAANASNGPQSRQPTRPERPDRPFSPAMENGIRSTGSESRGYGSPQPQSDASVKARANNMSPTPNNGSNLYEEESLDSPYKPATYQPQHIADTIDAQLPPSRTVSKAKRSQTPTERATDPSRPSMDHPSTDRPSMDRGPVERPSMDRVAMESPSMERPSMDRQVMERSSMDRQVMERPSLDRFPERQGSVPRRVESRQDQDRELPVDSGLGSSPALSQLTDNLNKELEAEKSRSAWYASELALARKAGYSSGGTGNAALDERGVESVRDDDKPLVEALLKMRAELLRIQGSIDAQAKSTAERIAEVERQRDAAVSEATFSKGKLAAYGNSPVQNDRGVGLEGEDDRAHGMNRKLASTLAANGDLSKKMESLVQEKECETQARQLAEESLDAHQKRITELDNDRQRNASELESLRAELHEAQRVAREEAANGAEAVSAHQLLTVNHNDLTTRHDRLLEESKNHAAILTSLGEAHSASNDKADLLARQLEERGAAHGDLETKLGQLKADHETLRIEHERLKTQHENRSVELESAAQRLRDAEALAEMHATEARTHKQVVLAGFGQIKEPTNNERTVDDERATVLQQQIEKANTMVRQNQAAADVASEKLRRAEERIAGLEAYQDQTSREGLTMRKQMQGALKEVRSLGDERARLQQQLQSQQLETNAITVQYNALKDILTERGISPSDFRKSRGLDSPTPASRFGASTPDIYRVRELEQQLETSQRTHDELKTHLDELQHREGITRSEYEDKLTALDNDHQAATRYLRGTEKMLSKLKQELQRVKNQNTEQLEELEALRAKDSSSTSRGLPAELEEHQQKLTGLQSTLQSREAELANLRSTHQTAQTNLATLQSSHDSSRADIERLQQENRALEERAKDAETKVQLLLDQVESHVDSYRRQSGQNPHAGMNGSGHQRGLSTATTATTNSNSSATTFQPGHNREESAGGESLYSNNEGLSEVSHGGEPDGRNSMALDSLANELDALRSHWETTNKNYRESDRFDYEPRTPTTAGTSNSEGHGNTLVNWRQNLRQSGDDDEINAGNLTQPPNMLGHIPNLDGSNRGNDTAAPVATQETMQ